MLLIVSRDLIKKSAKILGYIIIFTLFFSSTYRMFFLLYNDFNFLVFYGFLATLAQWVFLVKNINILSSNYQSIALDVILPIVNAFFFVIITFITRFVALYSERFFIITNPYFLAFLDTIIFVGFTISLIGIINLRKYFTLFAEANGLIKTGFYKYVRHPIYTGYIIVTLCLLILDFSLIQFIVSTMYIFLFYIRATREETLLISFFGKEYSDYKKNTGKFFPRVWG